MKRLFVIVFISFIALSGFVVGCSHHGGTGKTNKTWQEYLGDPHRDHYSSLEQINTSNVNQLKVAWTYATGDTAGHAEVNPIIIGDTLYGMNPTTYQPFALNAASGKLIWSKKNMVKHDTVKVDSRGLIRGLSYWREGKDQRILYTRKRWLYAVEATTGRTIHSFGDSGHVSLATGLSESVKNNQHKLNAVGSSSPGAIYKDLIIMPIRGDSYKAAIQAFNVKTGKLAWVFNTHPRPGEYGYNTWPKNAYKDPIIGGVNSWPGMSIDRERGIVYVPTNSPFPNWWGGERKGRNLFGNTLLALNAETGDRIWSYQIVHHDIIDRDLPAPPVLLTITRHDKKIPAVAQITKHGFIFLFNRVTGDPLFPIKEKPVPQSTIPGEHTWPTQPVPTKPAPFVRTDPVTVDDVNPYAKNKKQLMKIIRGSRSEGPFTPGSEQGTIIFPGFDGGGEWGGAAVDPTSGILYVNGSNAPWYLKLRPVVPKEQIEKLKSGRQLFTVFCSSCHGANRRGQPKSGIPSLVNIKERLSKERVADKIVDGGIRMPSFGNEFSKEKVKTIVAFLFGEKAQEIANMKESEHKPSKRKASSVRYTGSVVKRFVSKEGYPAVKPPWGVLSAINMNTGEYIWKDTLGTSPKLQEKFGIQKTGTPTYGGSLVTASNLLFIAATTDSLFKAYDKRTGKLLWKTKLPSTGFSVPATYKIDGRQYVVLACGGESELRLKKKVVFVAFALPK